VESADKIDYEDHLRKANWESGQIDYLGMYKSDDLQSIINTLNHKYITSKGKDSFTNILKKIQETITTAPTEVKEERERRKSNSPEVTKPEASGSSKIEKSSIAEEKKL
jgi:hypothetical protein